MAPGWYVLRTDSRAEYVAASELSRDGFEVYFPRIPGAQLRKGRPDTPLFPGYLFLHLDSEQRDWPTFQSIHRVAGWVNFAGEVPRIPDDVMTELMVQVDGMMEGSGLWKRFQPGDQVKVTSGHIETVGRVLKGVKSAQDKITVLLEFMGRLVPAQVPWQYLQAMGQGTDPENEEDSGHTVPLPRRTRGRGRWIQSARI